MKFKWQKNNSQSAIKEGWNVFNNDAHGLRIERIDDPENGSEPTFTSDADAIAHVERLAATGSMLHIMALSIHRESKN